MILTNFVHDVGVQLLQAGDNVLGLDEGELTLSGAHSNDFRALRFASHDECTLQGNFVQRVSAIQIRFIDRFFFGGVSRRPSLNRLKSSPRLEVKVIYIDTTVALEGFV